MKHISITHSRRVSIVPMRRMRFDTAKLCGSFFALLLLALMPALAQNGTKWRDLYLLAGTPTFGRVGGCPVNLYTIDPRHKLKLVREVMPGAHTSPYLQEGLYAVRDDMEDKIYVAYPHQNPTTVSVIHKEQPMMKDEVRFNPQGVPVLTTDFGLAAGDSRQSYLLCTLLPDRPVGAYGTLITVTGDAPAKESRIQRDGWSRYNSFRFQGAAGGPMGPGFATLGYIKDDHVRIQGEPGAGPFTMKLDLDGIPPFPLGDYSESLYIVVASARFFAFGFDPGDSSLYVHDRKVNTWKNLMSVSTIPYARRIFGSWLATIVEIWRPDGRGKNPGVENERNLEMPLLPDVRDLYITEAPTTSIPGTLLLDNLEDGRRITLDTGQEDSEILTVRNDGLVLYRVNDSIFVAQIEGEKLSKPSLVVKDEDVPEVHWVFWSHSATGALSTGK